MGRRQSILAAARGYGLDDVLRGLPSPEFVEGQLELPHSEALAHRIELEDGIPTGSVARGEGVQEPLW